MTRPWTDIEPPDGYTPAIAIRDSHDLNPADCPHLVIRRGHRGKAWTCYDCGATVPDEAPDLTDGHRPDPGSCAVAFRVPTIDVTHTCILDSHGDRGRHECACGIQDDGTRAPAVPADTIYTRG